MALGKIYIVENNKNDLITELSKKSLSKYKVYTFKEFKKELFYSYDNKTINFLMNKYKINYQIAKIYLDNLYYLEDRLYQSPKLNQLLKIKKDLQNNGYILNNHLFKKFLKNQEVIFWGYFTNREKSKLSNYIKTITEVRDFKLVPPKEYQHQIYCLSNIEEEITYVANQIVKLIKNNIPINQIYLTNLTKEYYPIVKRVFAMFNIPVNLLEKNSIFGTRQAKQFLNNLSNPLPVLTGNDEVTEKLINIYNSYTWATDLLEVKSLIINDLKSTYIEEPKLKNAVNECSFASFIPNENDYIFLLNFNQGSIPKIHVDEDFLNNDELHEIDLLDCNELNKIERQIAYSKIIYTKNLIITTKEKNANENCFLSNLNEELNYSVTNIINEEFTNSHLYNQTYLAKSLDNFYKYGTVNSNMNKLYASYPNIGYNSFDNSYKPISKNLLTQYLKDGLTLSYSSMDNYFRCSFRYYLNNILKLNIFEDTFMQTIGNIFHEVLEKSFSSDNNFEILWQNALNHAQNSYSKKEEFFLLKLKEELKFIIATINKQNSYSSLNQELHEEKVTINYEGNIKITFKGFIDKIKYLCQDDKTIVAIIDYKTGNPCLNLNYSIYGIEMQLPIYLFLAKNSPKLKNIKVAGFYLQKILNNEIVSDNIHTYDELKAQNLLLQGYSNEDIELLAKFDNSYNDSQVIKGMKTSAKGFYAYSKTLDTKTIDKLTEMVSLKIDEAIQNITEANFEINPKQIGKVNLGCEFCKFQDICFHKEKNVIKLPEYKNLEFLKEGKKNA